VEDNVAFVEHLFSGLERESLSENQVGPFEKDEGIKKLNVQ
jgi:hypothetical protein